MSDARRVGVSFFCVNAVSGTWAVLSFLTVAPLYAIGFLLVLEPCDGHEKP